MKTINLNTYNNNNYILNSDFLICLANQNLGFEYEVVKGVFIVKSTKKNNELFLKLAKDKNIDIRKLDNHYFKIGSWVYKLSGAMEYYNLGGACQKPQTFKRFENKKSFVLKCSK